MSTFPTNPSLMGGRIYSYSFNQKKVFNMAKVANNIFVRGLSGSLGEQFVIKRVRSGRTIIGNSPTFYANRVFSEAQQDVHERFREATLYARDAKSQAVYVNKAAGTHLTSYNVAVADWFHAPKIIEIDAQNWHGAEGETIRVKAVDDVQVTQVNVVITDNAGTVIEQGAAVQAEGGWWNYTTTVTDANASRIMVTARDLPGNVAEMNWD